jgi:hypothetical protein
VGAIVLPTLERAEKKAPPSIERLFSPPAAAPILLIDDDVLEALCQSPAETVGVFSLIA